MRDARKRRRVSASRAMMILCMCLPALVLGAGATVASAKAPKHVRWSVSVAPKGQRLTVRLGGRHQAVCVLLVRAGRRSIGFQAVRLNSAGHGHLVWTVPSDAPSGSWVFRASCRDGRVTHSVQSRLVLINHGTGAGEMIAPGSLALGGGTRYVGKASGRQLVKRS